MPPDEPRHADDAGDELYPDNLDEQPPGEHVFEEDFIPGADDGDDPACPRCGAVCSCADLCAECGQRGCVCVHVDGDERDAADSDARDSGL